MKEKERVNFSHETDNSKIEIILEAEEQKAELIEESLTQEEKLNAEKIAYLKSNIEAINNPKFTPCTEGQRLFGSKTNILSYLSIYFYQRLKDEHSSLSKDLMDEYKAIAYVKNKEVDLANKYIIYKNDLKKFYNKGILYSLKNDGFTQDEYIIHCLEFFQNKVLDTRKLNNVKHSLKEILLKQYDFIFTQGYLFNLLNINTGIMIANAGDSAQFLFLARAILLGYNCSNVDVRSSRYDAIIDFNGKLLRVQVKGVTDNSVSFKDRDRGGQGIDYTHENNIGKRITSKECDLYVAVDKQIGLCYIIPTKDYIDKLTDEEAKSVKLSNLQKYKENWSIIDEVIDDLF